MVSIVRQSKFRHVYGEELKVRFEEVRSTPLASEGPLVVSNGKYAAFCWETSGPGILSVLSISSEAGRVNPNHPWIKGHSGVITDFQFNPFNEDQIATGCEDAHIRLWSVTGGRIHEEIHSPVTTLVGHAKKVQLLDFHPSASYVLGSAGQDKSIKVWGIERGTAELSFNDVADSVVSLKWSPHGHTLGFATKDKMARGLDPRSNRVNFEFLAHDGSKPSKLNWINEHTLVTCGFSKTADRQLAFWDLRNQGNSLKSLNIDQSSGVIAPHFDADNGLLYVYGKGDGNIRYYEIVGDSNYLYYVESFKSTTPCKGVSFLPKHAVDTSVCEVMRAVKLTNNSVDFISFRVPRKSEAFQDDIYPDCLANVPAMSANQWFGGANTPPVRVPIQNVSSVEQVSVEIKAAKTVHELERELQEAHEEIARLKRRVAELGG